MGVKIVDTCLRDGHQSLLATRLTTEDILPVATLLDKAGYYALEVWGGATFDACLRFLNEDPWERLRAIRKACPNTKLQMLFRGQNILGYRHYSDELVEKFVEKSLENGIDMQDPFSWHENLPYTYPHWAYDTGTYIIYNLGENTGIGGFTAVYIATVVLSVILGIVIYLVNSKLSKNNIISFLVTLGVLYLLKNYIAARAQLVTFILFALTILFIENYIKTNKRIFLFGLLAISTFIANIHVAVWPFYFVLFLPYIAEYIMASIIESDLFYKMQVRRFKGRIEKFYKSGKEEKIHIKLK